MTDRIYLKDMPCYQKATELQKKQAAKNAFYDLGDLPSQPIREVMRAFRTGREQDGAFHGLFTHSILQETLPVSKEKSKGGAEL